MARIFLGLLALGMLCAGVVMGMVAIGATRRTESFSMTTSTAPAPSRAAQAKGAQTEAGESNWLSEYELTERSGRKFRSTELKGKVHVVNFFFAKCPTSCRTQTAAVQALHNEFGPQGVVFLSITVDPEHDTPVALAQYANEFHADPKHWLFLTGDLPYLRRVGAEVYFLPVDKQTHSESLLLLDRNGKIHGRFSWKDAKEIAKMKQAMSELLAEQVHDQTPTK
jgi:protein SCO1/2